MNRPSSGAPRCALLAVLGAVSLGAVSLGAVSLGAVSLVRAQDLEAYTVREGDTCGAIAERRYGNARRYDRIHEHNPQLGPMPHHLRPGTVLQLPPAEAADSSADAIVSDARGSVRSQEPTRTEWSGARVGEELYRGWRVSTGERSSAGLTFRSSSVAAIRAETLVIVHGDSLEGVRDEGSRAVLREGSMLSRLAALSGRAPLVVETPGAEVSTQAGETSVRVANGDTGVSAHAGSARVRAEGAEVEVPTGHGSHVRRGSRPSAPRPLPDPPAWAAEQSRAFLGVRGIGGTLAGRWLPSANARSYRIEIARRADGRDLVFSAEVPATVTAFEAHRFPAGEYFVRVGTIDAELLEGRPTDGLVFSVVGAELVAPGASPSSVASAAPLTDRIDLLEQLDALSDAALLEPGAPPAPEVLVGTRVIVPDGVVCAMGASEPAHELVLAEAGDGYLTCVDAQGANIAGLALHVAALRAEIVADDATQGGAPTLLRGETTAVRVVVREGEVDEAGLLLVGDESVEVGAPSPHPDGGLRVSITPSVDAPDQLTLVLAHRGAPGVALARASVATVAPVQASAPASEPTETRPFALHEANGLFATPSWSGLRDEQRAGQGTWVGIAGAGARLGEPDPRVRLVAGVQVGLLDEYLRLSAVVPLDVIGQSARSADRGARDVHFALGSRLLDAAQTGGVGLALNAGVWVPTAGSQGLRHARLAVSADFSLRFAERLALRTSQGGHFDLVADGSLLWTSAYGFDVVIAGPLSAGIEGIMTIGREDGRDWYAGGVGLGVGIDVAPVMISLGGRYGFGDDLWPTVTFAANARAAF